MVEILQPGTEVETYGMPAGSGMNGLKGVVVCYNASNGRYTFEDDAGSMMSLRGKNIKAVDEFVRVETVNNNAYEDNKDEDGYNEEPREDEKGSDQDRRKEDIKKESNQEPNEEPKKDKNRTSNQERKFFRIDDTVQYVNNGVIRKARITGIDFIGAKPIYNIRLLDSGVEKSTRPDKLMWLRNDEKGSDQDSRKKESPKRSDEASRKEKKESKQDSGSSNQEPRSFRVNEIVEYVRNGQSKKAKVIGADYTDPPSYTIRLLDSGVEKDTIGAYLRWSDQDSGEDESRPSHHQVPRVFGINDIVAYVRNGEARRARVIEVDYIGSQPSYTIHMLDSGVQKRTSGSNLFLVSAAAAPAAAAPVRQPNALDEFLFNVYKFITETITPTSLCVILLAIWWMWSSNQSPSPSTGSHSDDYYYHRSYYHSGWWGYGWGWGWGLGGLASLLFVGILIRKYGTNNGRMKFRWDRVWDRLMMMDFWELLRLAAVLEGALYFLGAAGGVGRRRR